MTRRCAGLCGVLLLTIMGLAYSATLRNPEEAKELAANDSAVKAGRLILEVHPWFAAKGLTVASAEPKSR